MSNVFTFTASSRAPGEPRRSIPPWVEARGILLIVLAVGLFYLWTAVGGIDRISFETRGLDFYNLLVDGFLDGHLHLKYEGTAGIEKLSNPYDPAQNAAYRVMDMSYYKGKYYIYFGPTPALILMLPWRVLTGFSLPSHLACVIFCLAGYILSLLLLLRWRARYFPALGAGPVWLVTLLVGTCSMAPALLRRAAVYEVAISCGYFCVMGAFYALDRATTAPRRPLLWLAGASAMYGLAILGRPTCIYGAIIFPLFLLWWYKSRRLGAAEAAKIFRLLTAGLAPLGAIFALMLLYNWARFGRPLEFGQIYQLTGRDMSQVKAFSLGYFKFDAWMYLFMPAQYSAYFPFFLNALPPAMPPGYDGLDDLYGIIPNLPVLLLGFAAIFSPPALGHAEFGRLRSALVLLLVWTAAVFGVFLFFSGATIRYYLDFLPALVLVAGVGIWNIFSRPRSASRRILVAGGVGLVSCYSVAFAGFVSMQHAGLFRVTNPAEYSSLARKFDVFPALYSSVRGRKFGPMRVQLQLPSGQKGRFEPLLVTGAFPNVDYLWILYTDDQHIQLGYEHTNFGGVASQPIRVDYNQPHSLQIEAGILYPPEADTFLYKSPNEALQLSRILRLTLDGTPYVDTSVSRYDPTRTTVQFGRNDQSTTFGTRFTGKVLSIARVPGPPVVDEVPRRGPARFSVVWPEGRVGHREPLVVTGTTGAGDILYVEYISATQVRFTLDHWGVGAVTSPAVTIAPGQIQVLEVEMSSLDAPRDPVPDGRIRIVLDGKEVMNAASGFHPAPFSTQSFGHNGIGGSTAEMFFTGKIIGLSRPKP